MISFSANILNWNIFITNRSLTENFFLCMVLYHWKHTEYAKWAQPLLLSRNLHAETYFYLN